MIRNLKRWQQWEDAHIAAEPPNPQRALAIANALYLEAKALGVWDQPFTLDSIRHKIQLAKALNVRIIDRTPRQ
jgi:hypothetical protein